METMEMITKEKSKANAIDLNKVIEYINGYRSVEEIHAIFDAFRLKDIA